MNKQNVSQFIHNDLGQYLTALNLEITHLEKEILIQYKSNQLKI